MLTCSRLFSLTLGVEPNKATLQQLAGTLNSAGKMILSKHAYNRLILQPCPVLSLADKQKALEQFADTAEAQKFVSQAPIPQQQFTQPQIQYIQAAPTPQAAQARKAKILRDPVVWQISEKQMKELQWKRKQLLRAQKAELERKKAARAKRPPPPKLGASKNGGNRTQQAKAPQPKASQPKAEPLKAPQAKATQSKAPATAKTPAKIPATSKTPAKTSAKTS